MVIGRLNDPKLLAGMGLGLLTLGVCVNSVIKSFIDGSAVLIGQAYGQEELRMCAVYRNRAIYLGFLMWLLIALPMFHIESIFMAIGQDAEVAAYATRWVQIIFPFFGFDIISFSYHSFAGY